MFASWFWGEYFHTDSFNDAGNPRLLAVKKRPGSAQVPPDYPPKKHTAAPPGHLPKKRSINPNSSPKKPYTTKNEAPKKRAKVVPEKTNMLPKKHARKNEHLLRKNKNVLPEKTACLSEKTCPWSKSTISRPKRFFGAFFRVARKNNNVFSERRPFFRVTRKNSKTFFRSFSGWPEKTQKTPKTFFRTVFGEFSGALFGARENGFRMFFRARMFVFSGACSFFRGAGLFFRGRGPHRADAILGAGRFGQTHFRHPAGRGGVSPSGLGIPKCLKCHTEIQPIS